MLTAPAPAADGDGGRLGDDSPLSSTTDRGSGPASTDMAAAPSGDVERLAVASLLALIAGGLTMWLVSLRWPQAPVASAAAPLPRDRAPAPSTAQELWLHSATPPVVEPEPGPPVAPPSPPAARPPQSSAPPEPKRAWAAEIEWLLVDDAAQFRVTARPVDRETEPVMLAASPALEWPPSGARSVQALTDAVKALESGLLAAGWTPLPPGSAWYAKRFTWQPGARPRPISATAGRTRHRKLYEAEFARQIDRTQRLRGAITERLIAQSRGADSTGTPPQ